MYRIIKILRRIKIIEVRSDKIRRREDINRVIYAAKIFDARIGDTGRNRQHCY